MKTENRNTKRKESSLKKILGYSLMAPFAFVAAGIISSPFVMAYRGYSSGFIPAYNEKIRECENMNNALVAFHCRSKFAYWALDLPKISNRDLRKLAEEIRRYKVK